MNNSELTLKRYTTQLEGLLDQLRIQRENNKHLQYTEKVSNTSNQLLLMITSLLTQTGQEYVYVKRRSSECY